LVDKGHGRLVFLLGAFDSDSPRYYVKYRDFLPQSLLNDLKATPNGLRELFRSNRNRSLMQSKEETKTKYCATGEYSDLVIKKASVLYLGWPDSNDCID